MKARTRVTSSLYTHPQSSNRRTWSSSSKEQLKPMMNFIKELLTKEAEKKNLYLQMDKDNRLNP
jgi:hypothetical protein